MPFKTAPLPASFMLVGFFGFIASILFWGKIGASWGFTFALFSVVLFVASLISLRASVELDEKKK